MSGVTARESINGVLVELEDPTGVFHSQEDVIDAYNEALDEISDATEIYEKNITVHLRKKATYLDLRGILPQEALRITSIYNCATNKWLDPITPRELDLQVGREWEGKPDTPRWWFMRGLWFLGVYPVTSDDTTALRIYYSALIPHVSSEGGLSSGLDVIPPLPPDAHIVIEDYMLGALWADRKEPQKAMQYWASYLEGEQQLKNLHEQRMTTVRTPRMGARRSW